MKVHEHCLPELDKQTCEVCGKDFLDESVLPPEIQDEIFRPSQNIEIEVGA